MDLLLILMQNTRFLEKPLSDFFYGNEAMCSHADNLLARYFCGL